MIAIERKRVFMFAIMICLISLLPTRTDGAPCLFTPIVYDSNGNRIRFSIEKAVDVKSGKDILLYPSAAKLGRDRDTIMFQKESE